MSDLVRMLGHSQNLLLVCVVILELFIFINGVTFSKPSHNLFYRNRTSYERHKTKEWDTNNKKLNVKTASPFVTENCTVVVAQIGGTATLPCVVRKFNSGVVSWIRKHDYHLLTVGLVTYNTDDRFMVEHVRHLQNWGLLIKKVQPSDAGLYECQMSTHPPSSIVVELKVTKALAEIQGHPELYIHSGSMLRLVCSFRDFTEPPEYVFWFHEQRMINYDPGVSVKKAKSSSTLELEEVDKSNNGNYTCSPSNAVPGSIIIHVLNATAEEKPAAMQHANSSCSIVGHGLVNCFVISVMFYPLFIAAHRLFPS